MDFLTADSHFFHPVYARDHETLISSWNARVGDSDTVRVLGDFGNGPNPRLKEILSRLQGRKILVQDLPDRSLFEYKMIGFEDWRKEEILETKKWGKLLLTHMPPSDERAKSFDFCLCGHAHREWARRGNVINVGVDVRDFEPKTLEELLT